VRPPINSAHAVFRAGKDRMSLVFVTDIQNVTKEKFAKRQTLASQNPQNLTLKKPPLLLFTFSLSHKK